MTQSRKDVLGLLSPKELSEMIDTAEQTLAYWRCSSQGPTFVKLGKNVFYRIIDVVSWIEKNLKQVEPLEVATS